MVTTKHTKLQSDLSVLTSLCTPLHISLGLVNKITRKWCNIWGHVSHCSFSRNLLDCSFMGKSPSTLWRHTNRFWRNPTGEEPTCPHKFGSQVLEPPWKGWPASGRSSDDYGPSWHVIVTLRFWVRRTNSDFSNWNKRNIWLLIHIIDVINHYLLGRFVT